MLTPEEKCLEDLFRDFYRTIAGDLAQCLSQKVGTTKLERRERAVAYVLDNLTGELGRFHSEQWVLDLLGTILALKANARTQEAKVAYERAERRLRWALDNPKEGLREGMWTCLACGEIMPPDGGNHECTNRRATSKDRTMMHDDTVKEVE